MKKSKSSYSRVLAALLLTLSLIPASGFSAAPVQPFTFPSQALNPRQLLSSPRFLKHTRRTVLAWTLMVSSVYAQKKTAVRPSSTGLTKAEAISFFQGPWTRFHTALAAKNPVEITKSSADMVTAAKALRSKTLENFVLWFADVVRRPGFVSPNDLVNAEESWDEFVVDELEPLGLFAYVLFSNGSDGKFSPQSSVYSIETREKPRRLADGKETVALRLRPLSNTFSNYSLQAGQLFGDHGRILYDMAQVELEADSYYDTASEEEPFSFKEFGNTQNFSSSIFDAWMKGRFKNKSLHDIRVAIFRTVVMHEWTLAAIHAGKIKQKQIGTKRFGYSLEEWNELDVNDRESAETQAPGLLAAIFGALEPADGLVLVLTRVLAGHDIAAEWIFNTLYQRLIPEEKHRVSEWIDSGAEAVVAVHVFKQLAELGRKPAKVAHEMLKEGWPGIRYPKDIFHPERHFKFSPSKLLQRGS